MKLSRRQLVQGSALLILGASVPCSAGDDLDELEVEMLKTRRSHLSAECERLDRSWREAHARMPWHLLPGPKFMDEHGELCGPRVGWPAALSDSIELSTGSVLIRPSPRDLHELLEVDLIEVGRERAAVSYRNRIRQLRDRIRAKRQWESEARMPRTSDWAPLDLEIDSIDARLQSLVGKAV